jgi:putative MATE family efflux protein
MRSTGRARTPLTVTTCTVLLEGTLAFLLVLGVGPIPRLGVPGAGVALATAAVVKAGLLLWQVFGHRDLRTRHRPRLRGAQAVLGPLARLAMPLALTSLLWSVGNFLFNAVAARLGDEALAGLQIAVTIEGVFFVASFGLASAANALVGRALGARDTHEARAWVRAVTRTGAVTGVLFGAAYMSTALALPVLYPQAGAQAREVATTGILVYGLSQVLKVRNFVMGAGVLPSAGEVRWVVVGDSVGAFLVGLPAAVALGMATPLGMTGLFLARVAEEAVKVLLFSWRVRRVRWTETVRAAAL